MTPATTTCPGTGQAGLKPAATWAQANRFSGFCPECLVRQPLTADLRVQPHAG